MSIVAATGILARLADAGIRPSVITSDSRAVAPGDVFAAWPGFATDGRHYIGAAVERGAAAVVWDSGDGFDAGSIGVPSIAVPELRQLAGFLGHLVYGRPSESLWMAGVTGTNGKTTVSQWLALALGELGERCGVIGTLGNGFPGQLSEAMNTTPGPLELHRCLAGFLREGAAATSMEVSSIGLEQGRVNGVAFDVAIFTNLSRDHLDYHKNMEAYAAAKALLFALPGVAHAVINLDDSYGMRLARNLVERGLDVTGYTQSEANAVALAGARMLVAQDVRMVGAGLRFTLVWGSEKAELQARMVARFNVSNLLAVIAALLLKGISLEEAVWVASKLTPPAGRMQLVGGVGEPLVIVDYAHSPDALAKVLEAARPTAVARGGKLVCVFGCGGDRDPGKRPLMGEIAARLADRVVVTSDNPRTEAPQRIIDEIRAGIAGPVELVVERAMAIGTAVAQAAADDVIVLAGKGHEPYQEVMGKRHPFSDEEEARRALAAWHAAQGEGS